MKFKDRFAQWEVFNPDTGDLREYEILLSEDLGAQDSIKSSFKDKHTIFHSLLPTLWVQASSN